MRRINIVSGVISVCTKMRKKISAIFLKRNKNRYKRKVEDDTYDRDYVAYIFEDFEQMNEAIISGRFNVFSSYQIEGVPHLVVIADGTEDDLVYYGGRRIVSETYLDDVSNDEDDTMYFKFEDEENLKLFWIQLARIYSANLKMPVLSNEEGLYLNLQNIDESFRFRVIGLALEYMGEHITDKILVQKLEKYFS